MARVHLFTPSSSNERRRHSPEHNIAEEASVPTLPEDSEHENKTISVSSQPTEEQQQQQQQQQQSNVVVDTSSPTLSQAFIASPEQKPVDNLTDQLTSSSAALTAALLQNAQGNNDMVGAVAAALSVKPDTFQLNNNNDKTENTPSQPSDSLESRKPEDSLDQAAVAATALQLLGLSHSENKEKQSQSPTTASTDNTTSRDLLIANYPGISASVDDIDLASDDMMQDYKRGTWTREEDELLLAGIKKYGYGRWKEIATSIPGRKGKQLKQRWDNTLAAKYVDQEWIKNKIRTEEALQRESSSSSDDKTLKFLEATDWNDIAMKITEKAREGDQHAIEALLSQALLGTVASHAAAATAAAAAAAASTSEPTNTTTANTSTNNSTTASPLQHHTSTMQHPQDSNPTTPTTSQTNEAMNLNFSRAALDSNNPPPLNYADAAALALYASHLSQHASSSTTTTTAADSNTSSALNLSNHPYFLPFGSTSSDTNAVAAAAAAAVAAVAQQQQNKDNDNTSANQSTYSPSVSPSLKTSSRAAVGGHKRRRSDPALADTQSAAMTIYASSTPITTTINNQTQTVYPCLFPNCGKTFARLYNLKSHSRTHTDDRPFVCQACDAAFSRNHDLKRHSKIHGGAKPYTCEGCKKSFSRLDALKRHKSNQRNKQSCTQE